MFIKLKGKKRKRLPRRSLLGATQAAPLSAAGSELKAGSPVESKDSGG